MWREKTKSKKANIMLHHDIGLNSWRKDGEPLREMLERWNKSEIGAKVETKASDRRTYLRRRALKKRIILGDETGRLRKSRGLWRRLPTLVENGEEETEEAETLPDFSDWDDWEGEEEAEMLAEILTDTSEEEWEEW